MKKKKEYKDLDKVSKFIVWLMSTTLILGIFWLFLFILKAVLNILGVI
jgi:hypothetical protein|tara:strand:+ start:56 stop:199 length:144 start_codon:yes stop_codon:yes gene_type:complete